MAQLRARILQATTLALDVTVSMLYPNPDSLMKASDVGIATDRTRK